MKTAIFVYTATTFETQQALQILVFSGGQHISTLARGPGPFSLDPGFYGVLTADPPVGTPIVAPLAATGGVPSPTATVIATADKDDWPDPPPKAGITLSTLNTCLPNGKGQMTDLA